MFDKEFDIAELIARRQKQELDAADELLLQKWLEADAANTVLLASLSGEDSIREKLKAFEAPDSKALWEKVIGRLGQDAKVQPRISKLWPHIGIAAAIALMVFGAGLFYFYLNNNRVQVNQNAYKNDVAPGKTGATLTLSSGRKVRLAEAANGELAKQAGVVITKTANGQLIYKTKVGSDGSDQVNILTTDNGETYQVRLPDGSLVWLNAASTLKYPASFVKLKDRRVELKGEGYFEIAKDKAHPFIVKTGTHQVEVLGTHFNVNAYADKGVLATTLLEGSVKVSSGTQLKIIRPGEQSTLMNGHLNVGPANIEKVMAWKNGYFSFNDENIQSIMQELSRWYNVEIKYEGEISSQGFYAKISRNNNISQVLNALQSTKAIHFKVEGRRVTITQ